MIVKINLTKFTLPFREALGIAISTRKRNYVLHTPLYANSIYLMANSVVIAIIGFIFWIVVARFYLTETVGLGSALISAASLLTFIASLGLGNGLIRFLPEAGANAPALINSSFTISCLAAIIASIIFLVGLPLWSPALGFVRHSFVFMAAFVTFVIAGTLFSQLNQALVALRRAKFVFLEGILNSMVKIGAVVALASFFQVFGIFASWGLSATVAVIFGILLFLPRVQPGYRPFLSLHKEVSNDMLHFSFANYASNGLWSLPTWLLPIIIVNLLGGETNAYFFISWSMAGLLFAIPFATSTALFAEGSHHEESLARDIIKSLKLTAVIILPAIVVMLAAGDKMLLLFGREYSIEGEKLLWILVPSAIPLSVTSVYLGIARVKKRLKEIILIPAALAVGTLGLSYAFISRLGILSPGVGWLVTQTLVALALIPKLKQSLRTNPALVSDKKQGIE